MSDWASCARRKQHQMFVLWCLCKWWWLTRWQDPNFLKGQKLMRTNLHLLSISPNSKIQASLRDTIGKIQQKHGRSKVVGEGNATKNKVPNSWWQTTVTLGPTKEISEVEWIKGYRSYTVNCSNIILEISNRWTSVSYAAPPIRQNSCSTSGRRKYKLNRRWLKRV